jgi:hypothetical protein
VTSSHASLLEIDYNLHKSNSTYFADLDASRCHLVMYLCRSGMAAVSANAKTKLVVDPRTGMPATGKPNIALGAAHTSFRREIAPYARYEMWSRVLAWDRKWLYIVTHFVPAGTVKPTEWLDPRFGLRGVRKGQGAGVKSGGETDWESKVLASSVSKYVFKLGRLTIRPDVVLGASGLLPERPGGWAQEETAIGLGESATHEGQEWDWQRVEARRRHGMIMAANFHALDGLSAFFDGGDDGALGMF